MHYSYIYTPMEHANLIKDLAFLGYPIHEHKVKNLLYVVEKQPALLILKIE
jgi:hypothetical protein